MQPRDDEMYRLHARMPRHRHKIAEARRIIADGLARCDRPYVAFSAGKDSAAMLHLVREVRPDIPARIILWRGESEHLGDFDRVLAEWGARGPSVEVLELERDSLDSGGGDRWGQLHALGASDAVLVGIRQDESAVRRMTLRKWGAVHRAANGMLRIAPLAWMSTRDIGAIVLANDLPCLAVYREHGFDERTTSRVPRQMVRDWFAQDLRERDPVAWARLCRKWPELRQAG